MEKTIYNFLSEKILLLAALFLIFAPAATTLAHEGHDHSKDEPAAVSTGGEIETRSGRVGDYEILMKSPPLEPDTPVEARLFLVWAQTNAPISNAVITVTIERENDRVMEINAEADAKVAGGYTATIPAISSGKAKIGARWTLAGTTEQIDFGTADIHVHDAAQPNTIVGNWLPGFLFAVATVFVLALIAGIVWFGVRRLRSGEETIGKAENQTVSA